MDGTSHHCARCGNPLASTARFCGKCGAPQQEAAAQAAVKRPLQPGDGWRHLSGVLALWVWLVAAIGISGLAATLTEDMSPRYDAAGSIALVLVVCYHALRERKAVGRLLAARWLSLLNLVVIVTLVAALLGFMYVYMAGLTSLGVEELDYLPAYREFGWPMWSAVLLMVITPAVFEELAFRGVIFERLLRVGSPSEAIAMQAILFSVLHLSPVIFISHFVLGLAFGWLRAHTGSVVPGMLAHGLYNGVLLVQEALSG
jgi:membrane protease YdiL (CAAX protease family)